MRDTLRLLVQYAQFGAVGLAAATTHVLIYTACIELGGVAPLLANTIAFAVAVLVSFFGHSRWAFREQTAHADKAQRHVALLRFVVVALVGFALNSLAVYFCVNVMGWPDYTPIAFMLTVVPLAVFMLSKFWAFASPAGGIRQPALVPVGPRLQSGVSASPNSSSSGSGGGRIASRPMKKKTR